MESAYTDVLAGLGVEVEKLLREPERSGRAVAFCPCCLTQYVGGLGGGARRTRARRLGVPAFFKEATAARPKPDKPVPVPDDLKVDAIEAFWASQAWQRTSWLGRKVGRPPGDLFAYQELIERVSIGIGGPDGHPGPEDEDAVADLDLVEVGELGLAVQLGTVQVRPVGGVEVLGVVLRPA